MGTKRSYLCIEGVERGLSEKEVALLKVGLRLEPSAGKREKKEEHEIGQRYHHEGSYYILSMCGWDRVVLVNLNTGTNWSDPCTAEISARVGEGGHITGEAFERLIGEGEAGFSYKFSKY